MTTVFPDSAIPVAAGDGVYPPQHDSLLLIDALRNSGLAHGRRVADLCTGSGVVAIAAAKMGARDVTAFEICPIAVACAQTNADVAGVRLNMRLGSWTQVQDCRPFDVVVANPPYVPAMPGADTEAIPASAGPSRAWDAGHDGRMILDPLCDSAADLLTDDGTLLLVHSGLANADESMRRLRKTGLRAEVFATQFIPFGPVLRARATWLERTGQIPVGRRVEELVVIRADKS
ncbi:MAG: HemK2/MTQ2 family protein methyltransferase [Mycobacterium sp.]